MRGIITFLFPALCMALSAHAQGVAEWQADVARWQSADWDCGRGETLRLAPSFVSGRSALDLSGIGEASFHWQTNGMGHLYWQAPARIDTHSRPHRLVADFEPWMDCGAAKYDYFFRAGATNGPVQYRAHGTIRMRGAPGETPNALPLPTPFIDFAKVAWTNAPWGEGGGEGGGTDGQAMTNIVEGIVTGMANNPFIPNWGGFITNQMGYVGFPEGYPTVDIAQTDDTGVPTSRLVAMPDKIYHFDGTNSNYYHFPHIAGSGKLHQTFALQSDIPNTSGFLRTTGDQSLKGSLNVANPRQLGGTQLDIGNDALTFSHGLHETTYSRDFIRVDGSAITLPESSGTLVLDSDLAPYATRSWTLSTYGGTNAWMAIDGDLLGIYSCTNAAAGTNTLWESSSAMGGQLANVAQRATNNTARITALEARPDLTSWGDYAPDGTPNPDAEAMVYLNKALTLMGSGFSWATSGSYACLCQSGAVAFQVENAGEIRIGTDVTTNYFGLVQGGSVTVGCRTDGIRVADGVAYLSYAYVGGTFPVVWFCGDLVEGVWQETTPVWTDNGDGTATAAVPATGSRGFWKATSTRETGAYFRSNVPAHFPAGVYGALASEPVRYDSVITVTSGGHTYRIPAELVQ